MIDKFRSMARDVELNLVISMEGGGRRRDDGDFFSSREFNRLGAPAK